MDTLGETAPPKENAQTSFEDEDDARQSNIDAIGKQFCVITCTACIKQAKNIKKNKTKKKKKKKKRFLILSRFLM